MAMISICAITYDVISPLIFELSVDSKLQAINRRVTRTQTLDLGCSITDRGVTNADRAFTIALNLSEEEAGQLYNLVNTWSLLTFAIDEGVFTGVVSSYQNNYGNVNLNVLIKEKL